jgi:ribosome-associated protein
MAAKDLIIRDDLVIPGSELELSFARSSGAGGQNVNKVSSQAQLRYALRESTALPEDVKSRLFHLARGRITNEGALLISSQRYRDQGRNIADCYEKLKALIERALEPPEPRRPTRPSRGAVQRRLNEKKHRAEVKRTRAVKD